MLNFLYPYFALLVANTIVDAIFRRKLYPPGPRKLPFIGNLFTMPAERQWVKFSKWAKQYGPIVHATVGSQHIVILNTPEVINDLFVQKSRILSDRLESYVAFDILSARQRLLYMSGQSDEFRASYPETVPRCNER
ncbi:cytochrome p450 [Moniliophthora roreri MCA 2997]|uniref:Cytochrome p450 n=1 Tax=Moniliophthora roreri (strain MCA 2997) TaxID=1381753 RepID=V2WXC3_MONRO|nr:cytochrome p450 [Moniliophthora roreri MCA 2997]